MKKANLLLKNFVILIMILFFFLNCTKEVSELNITNKFEFGNSSCGNIEAFSVTVSTIITNIGDIEIVRSGHCWSEDTNPDLENEHSDLGVISSNSTFTTKIENLNPATKYYIRPYVGETPKPYHSEIVLYGPEFEVFTSLAGAPCEGIPTVVYEGKTYHTVQIGTQCWLKENLNIGTMINASNNNNQINNSSIEKYCYNNETANCEIYGGLYQWDEMMQYTITQGTQGICPNGWHIPTDDEWTTLIDLLGGSSIAGVKLKESGTTHWNSPNTGATNSSGFTALPGGHGFSSGYFSLLGINGIFWSSTQYTQYGTGTAWRRYLGYNDDGVGRDYDGKGGGFSARCLQD